MKHMDNKSWNNFFLDCLGFVFAVLISLFDQNSVNFEAENEAFCKRFNTVFWLLNNEKFRCYGNTSHVHVGIMFCITICFQYIYVARFHFSCAYTEKTSFFEIILLYTIQNHLMCYTRQNRWKKKKKTDWNINNIKGGEWQNIYWHVFFICPMK